jgi:hypothetical protein
MRYAVTALLLLAISNLIALGLYHRQRQETQRLRRMFRITLHTETRTNQ